MKSEKYILMLNYSGYYWKDSCIEYHPIAERLVNIGTVHTDYATVDVLHNLL